MTAAPPGTRLALVGCYTTPDRRGRGRGVEVFRVDETSGRWTHLHSFPAVNPSYLALDAAERTLYVAHGATPRISALRLDPATGDLWPLSEQLAGGLNPVHVVVTPDGRHLLAANYTSGELVALPIGSDGSLEPVGSTLRLEGRPGPITAEQRGPHPHHLPLSPEGRWLIVPDKGLDQVFVAGFDAAGGLSLVSETPARPGAGPRHACFHDQLPLVYVNNELDSTVTSYELDTATGKLHPLETTSTLPPGFSGDNATGEIVFSASRRAVYISNRDRANDGRDTIASFRVEESGLLTPLGWQPSGGHFPRFITLAPDGRRLYVANQDADAIVALALLEDGRLAPPETVVATGSPACIVFTSSRFSA